MRVCVFAQPEFSFAIDLVNYYDLTIQGKDNKAVAVTVVMAKVERRQLTEQIADSREERADNRQDSR
jgi:hypothetical protein